MNSSSQHSINKLLLIVAFLEGASVMVIELLGAKIIAPFYGTSLYVWSSVLGVTLAALATGYYAGGWASQKYPTFKPLLIVLVLGSLLVLFIPTIAPKTMVLTSGLGVRFGSLLSVVLYLFPPVACMGMVTPIITQLINKNASNAGRSAGTVYAVSTFGGIIATFIAGFYLIPDLGIIKTAYLTSGILMVAAMLLLISAKKYVQVGVSVFSFFIILSLSQNFKSTSTNKDVIVQYQSSGILGQWTVVDKFAALYEGERLYTRQLLLNGIDQTYIEAGSLPISQWLYPHKLAALASIKPAGSKALILGMGGGSITYSLKLLDFNIDIVELDARVPEIAEKWFRFDALNSNVIIDDARHYIKNCTKKYDIIVMDMVNGEVQPAHVFTKEGLLEMSQILNEDALIIVNFQGRLDANKPEQSLGPRSVYKTFQSAGFDMYIAKQPTEKPDLSDDLLIYGSPGKLNFEMAFKVPLRYNSIFEFEEFKPEDYEPQTIFSLMDAQVLLDDRPRLELVNAPIILDWRQKKIDFTLSTLMKNNFDLYK